jgi:hypothetical protein
VGNQCCGNEDEFQQLECAKGELCFLKSIAEIMTPPGAREILPAKEA